MPEDVGRLTPHVTCISLMFFPSPTAPTMCPFLEAPAHGTKFGSKYFVGHEIHFTCSHGYSLLGSATRLCQDNGTWSGISAICKGKRCYCHLSAITVSACNHTSWFKGKVQTHLIYSVFSTHVYILHRQTYKPHSRPHRYDLVECSWVWCAVAARYSLSSKTPCSLSLNARLKQTNWCW